MQIKHYTMDAENVDRKLFNKLLKKRLYSPTGVFEDLYSDPDFYIDNKLYVSVATYRRSPVSVMVLGENMYFNWDKFNTLVESTFGLISFYTLPEYRGKGYAKAVFEDFDKQHKFRKLSTSPNNVGILKSVDSSDLIIVHGA